MNPFAPLAAVLLLVHALPPQQPDPGMAKDDDVIKAGPKDPFTAGEEKAMQALGVVSYGPLPWADGLRTTDVEKVLGENRVLWLETAHFRIGCGLGTSGSPDDPEVRKLLNAEMQRLNKRWSKVPARASKLSPWLRLHLYAQRAEELYAEFAQLVGHDEASGTFLGQPDKFLILLFQRKSDLARYLDRFCGREGEQSQRHFHSKSRQNAVLISAEADEPRDEASVHAQFRFFLMQVFQDAGGGAPYWLSLGLAHRYERQVPAMLMNCGIREDEHVDQATQNKWREKVRARAQRPELCIPFLELCRTTDFGYFGHLQAWSRVDCLMALDRVKFGRFLAGVRGGASAERQQQLLEEFFGMDAEAFDARWREWVAKNYK
jgi:hypothetical protein